MLPTRKSHRLAAKPRVDYTQYFTLVCQGSISSLESYDLYATPKSVMKHINTVKKMRLNSGDPAAIISVRRSARIANKNMNIRISHKDIGSNNLPLFTEYNNCVHYKSMNNENVERPEFFEYIRTSIPNVNEMFASLLFGISTTKDLYGDIIKITEMYETYPHLNSDEETQDSLRVIGKYMSVRFLADELALKSDRCNDISNAISSLLAM